MTTPPPLHEIGKFQVTDLIGEGAMGIVYRAKDPVLHRYVAVKLMTDAIARETHLRDRFMREARAAGSLQHPNIVTIYDCGDFEGHLYIAMEYIEGADLAEVIGRRDPLPLGVKLDIIIDVLNGLSYAHQRGVVHRDIKPANIRVTEDGRAKIMDFGIAHVSESNMTKSGVIVGTPDYMAPEQITGGQITPATDVFAVGGVLYELLTNARPFTAETLHAVLYKVVSEDPPSVRELVPGIPADVQEIVTKALAKEPADRYATAADMAHALTAARTAISGVEAAPTLVRKTPLHTLPPIGGKHRRRLLVVGGSVAGVAAVAALAVFGPWRAQPQRQSARAAAPVIATDSAAPVTANTTDPHPAASPVPAPPTARPESAVAEPPASVVASTPPVKPAPKPTKPPAAATTKVTASPPDTVRPDSAATAGAPDSAVAATVTTPIARPTPPPPHVTIPVDSAPRPPVETGAMRRAQIDSVVAAYARAIESRDTAQMVRLYPSMPADQRQGWDTFFHTVRNLDATLAVSNLTFGQATATGHVTGMYQYENASTGGAERRPVQFVATFARTAPGVWVLTAIH